MKCAPKIWKKFTKRQKLLWTAFYKGFYSQLKMMSILGKEVIAHNLACEAVWVESDEVGLYE